MVPSSVVLWNSLLDAVVMGSSLDGFRRGLDKFTGGNLSVPVTSGYMKPPDSEEQFSSFWRSPEEEVYFFHTLLASFLASSG